MLPQGDFLPLLIGGMGAFTAMTMGAIKYLFDRSVKQLDKRFDTLEEAMRGEAKTITSIKEDFLSFKAQLPIDYIRREEFERRVGELDDGR